MTRYLNMVSAGGSYLWSLISGRVAHRGMPMAVSIEPTNRCNLRCPECPSGTGTLTRPRGFMAEALYRNIIGQLSPQLLYLTLYFEGEPYLHPDFCKFVSLARERRIYVASSTNGHFLTEENARATVDSGLNRLIISVDGADQQTYAQYRAGGNLQQVLDGIGTLSAIRKQMHRRTPEIVFQCLMLRSNEHQFNRIRNMGIQAGADRIRFKTAQFLNLDSHHPLMPANELNARYYRTGIRTLAIKHRQPNACFRMWSSCVITWDGHVVPCCFDKDALHPMGDLTKQSFLEIWHGKRANDFRKQILTSRKSIDMCLNCTQSF